MTRTRLPSLLLTLLALAACQSALLQAPAPPASTPVPAVPTTSEDPAIVLQQFMQAWSGEDYEGMYSRLASRSRALYPRLRFRDLYASAHSAMGFLSLQYRLQELRYQGRTAILHYQVEIASSLYGRLVDDARQMRLVQEAGWKIAWTPMDILQGMSSRSRLVGRAEYLPRASIFAADGRALAASDAPIYSLYAIQQDMPDADACRALLARLMRQPPAFIDGRFREYLPETFFHVMEMDQRQYEANQQSLAAQCAIAPGGAPFEKVRRFSSRSSYGHGTVAHIVGYIGAVPADELASWEARGYSASDIIGRSSLELAYEEVLAGKPQRFLRVVAESNTILRELAGEPAVAPQPLNLTIDIDLQSAVAQAISDAVIEAAANWGGQTPGGAVAALAVDSGRVLALSSYPSFDPHLLHPDTDYQVQSWLALQRRTGRDPFENKALAQQYTPGSVYKIVTALATAEEGIWGLDEPFDCGHYWDGSAYGDSQPLRRDWRLLEDPPRPPAGPVTLAQALAASCNPFFYEMGALLYLQQPDTQVRLAQRLGLGSATGLAGLGLEASGDVAPPGDIAAAINNAIGQGNVTVTVLQMAQMTAAIANGGTLWQPFVVESIGMPGSPDFRRENVPTPERELSLDAAALAGVQAGMCQVTTDEDFGTAWFVFDDAPFSICGKTGTAETAGNPHSWFVAYTPRDAPEIAFAGVMAHSREGSEVVAPIIRRALDDYLGLPRKPFPDWWQGSYIPLKTQAELAAEELATAAATN